MKYMNKIMLAVTRSMLKCQILTLRNFPNFAKITNYNKSNGRYSKKSKKKI